VPYVRDRVAPASKEHARKRRAINRAVLAPDPAHPGSRYDGAYDWFRIALVYARRRSYRTLAIGDAAHARRIQIIADAAAMLQAAGCAIDEAVPLHYASRSRRAEFRDAYHRAPAAARVTDKPTRLYAANAWVLVSAAQAGKYVRRGGDRAVLGTVAALKDAAAAKLIEWAEEMDADDYGE
jgi:hypothetical protein